MTAAWRIVKDRVRKIGRLRLYRHQYEVDRWAVSLDNSTYHRFMEIPPDRVTRWLREFDVVPPDRFTK